MHFSKNEIIQQISKCFNILQSPLPEKRLYQLPLIYTGVLHVA